MADPVQVTLAMVFLLLPGFMLVKGWLPRMDWARTAAASVVVAFTVPPATVYALNASFGVPFTPMMVALTGAFFTWLGLAAWARRPLERAWG